MPQELQDLARRQMGAASYLAEIFVAAAGRIAAENSEFAGLTFRNNSAWLSELAAVRSMPEFVQVQSENARANYLAMIGQTKKLGAIISEMMEQAIKTAPTKASPALVPARREKRAA